MNDREHKDSINRRIADRKITIEEGHAELDAREGKARPDLRGVEAFRVAARAVLEARRTFAQEIEARREERGPNPMAAAEPERDHGPGADYEALIMDERGDEYL
jgi:hypothetical protein